MGNKDIVSRHLLKRVVKDLAHYLFHLDLKNIEVLETQYQRVEDRRADLVVKAQEAGRSLLVHIEVQNTNEKAMPFRMLRYYTDIVLCWPNSEVEQYLIYIGKPKLLMSDAIQQHNINYKYHLIDMHNIDCQTFLKQDKPDALVLAILCDFKGQDEREVIHYIIQRLKFLTKDNESAFREYISMLELLSTNRNLSVNIKEEEKMLTAQLRDLPSFEVGYEEGIEKGIEKGVEKGIEKIAKQMLLDMDEKTVAKYTGLSIKVIRSLKEK